MSPPTSPVCPPTPLYAHSSQVLQLQSTSAATNTPHPTSTAPLPTSVYTDTLLSLQPQVSYLDQGSPVTPSTPRASCISLPPHTPSPNTSLPDSTSTSHSSSRTLVFHPLLRYSQHSRPALVWDVCTDPTSATLLQESSTHRGTIFAQTPILVPAHELRQLATDPPLDILHLLCGIAPHASTWRTINVTASLRIGVTVLDVLNAVRQCMRTPITHPEWNALCKKQQDRVNETFDSRWRMSRTPVETRGEGVLRQDFLLLHTLWGGLMPSFVGESAAVLTLAARRWYIYE